MKIVVECSKNKLTPQDEDVANANKKPNFEELFTNNDLNSYNQNQEKAN